MKTKRIITIAVVCVAAVFAVIIFFTGEEPEEDRIAREEREQQVTRSLEVKPAGKEAKELYNTWLDKGFIVKIDKFSHQVWLDTDEWKTLSKEEMRDRIDVISEVFSEIDGTFQVMARDPADDTFLADYFADNLRLNEAYLQ